MKGEKVETDECCFGKISEGILANCGVSMPEVKVKSWEGWIGHSLNPIGCLFETLVDANRISKGDKNQKQRHECVKDSRTCDSSKNSINYHDHCENEG